MSLSPEHRWVGVSPQGHSVPTARGSGQAGPWDPPAHAPVTAASARTGRGPIRGDSGCPGPPATAVAALGSEGGSHWGHGRGPGDRVQVSTPSTRRVLSAGSSALINGEEAAAGERGLVLAAAGGAVSPSSEETAAIKAAVAAATHPGWHWGDSGPLSPPGPLAGSSPADTAGTAASPASGAALARCPRPPWGWGTGKDGGSAAGGTTTAGAPRGRLSGHCSPEPCSARALLARSGPEPCPPASTVPSPSVPRPHGAGLPSRGHRVCAAPRAAPVPCERDPATHPVLHVVDGNMIVFDPEVPSAPGSAAHPRTQTPGQGHEVCV